MGSEMCIRDRFRFCTVEFFNLIGDEFANSINFGEQYFVVVIQGENRKFKKKIKKLKPTLFIDGDVRFVVETVDGLTG